MIADLNQIRTSKLLVRDQWISELNGNVQYGKNVSLKMQEIR